MELTTKEKSRNNKISLAVTIFSFAVLLVFLVFRNVMFPNASLNPMQPQDQSFKISLVNEDNTNSHPRDASWFPDQKSNTGKKQLAVSDDDLYKLNDVTSRLLAQYRSHVKNQTNDNGFDSGENLKPANSLKTNKDEGEAQLGYQLLKRELLNAPKLEMNTSEEGSVIVDIVVDKNGTVISANPNGRGTSTNNAQLKTKAKEMAMLSKFSPAPGIEEQRGTITINFSFN